MDNNKNNEIIRVIAFWGIFAVIIGGMIFGMVKVASHNNKNTPLSLANAITEGDWIRGSKEAKVVITEYSDFQCPACVSYYSLIKQLHKDFEDKLAIVYRHFPLSQHENAKPAAIAAEAAGKQGKFWEMHDMLFESQKNWENEKNAQKIFMGYAKKLELNLEKFKQDLASKEAKEKVEADYQSGVAVGVNHTPTFFMNSWEIQNPRTYEEFKNIINEAESKKL